MSKFYTVTKEIYGKNYTAQYSGLSTALRAVDRNYVEGTRNTSTKKMAEYLFEHIVVEPKLKINDFGADNIGKEYSKEINGTTYKAKFRGLETALNAVDGSYIDDSKNTSVEKLTEYLLEKVITSPENLSIDDFESIEELNEVIAFAQEVMQGGEAMDEFNAVVEFAQGVMQGDFREQADKSGVKATSSK